MGSKNLWTYSRNAIITPISTEPPETKYPPITTIKDIVAPTNSSTGGCIPAPNFAALLVSLKFVFTSFSNLCWLISSRIIFCVTLTPFTCSLRTPFTTDDEALALRNAFLALGSQKILRARNTGIIIRIPNAIDQFNENIIIVIIIKVNISPIAKTPAWNNSWSAPTSPSTRDIIEPYLLLSATDIDNFCKWTNIFDLISNNICSPISLITLCCT